jgi:DNA repair protein RecO (recombination protein O)
MTTVEKFEGFVVHALNYSETSLIVTWLTRERGVLKTMAKGARRPKNRFSGKLDLFYRAIGGVKNSRKSLLHTLTDVELMDQNAILRESYAKIFCLSYFMELIHCLVEPDTPIPEDFHLFELALEYLKAHEPSRLFVDRFEIKLSELHGLNSKNKTRHDLENYVNPKALLLRKKLLKELNDAKL